MKRYGCPTADLYEPISILLCAPAAFTTHCNTLSTRKSDKKIFSCYLGKSPCVAFLLYHNQLTMPSCPCSGSMVRLSPEESYLVFNVFTLADIISYPTTLVKSCPACSCIVRPSSAYLRTSPYADIIAYPKYLVKYFYHLNLKMAL